MTNEQGRSGVRKAGRIRALPEAVAALVRDGSFVSLEGFTHLIPFAAGHELLRQGHTDLTVVRLTPDILFDQMIGSGGGRFLITSAQCLIHSTGLPFSSSSRRAAVS